MKTAEKVRHSVFVYGWAHPIPEQCIQGDDGQLSGLDQSRILLSQFAIARALWDWPDAIVFNEGQHAFWGPEVRSNVLQSHPLARSILKSFSDCELPTSPELLSAEQQDLLLKVPAVQILYIVGRVTEIYQTTTLAFEKTLTGEINTLVRKHGSSWFEKRSRTKGHPVRSRVFDERELMALDQIKEYLEIQSPLKKKCVVLVFGSEHNFERWRHRYGFDIYRINTDPLGSRRAKVAIWMVRQLVSMLMAITRFLGFRQRRPS